MCVNSFVCRLCFMESTKSIDLEATSNVGLKKMFDIFMFPKKLQLPHSICEECSNQAQTCYRFFQLIIQYIEANDSTQEPQNDAEETLQSCDVCHSAFTTDLDLERHRKLVHIGLVNRNFQCLTCRKHFKTNRGLQQHTNHCQNSTGNESFHCTHCSRDFATGTSYTNHVRSCHAEAICYFCDHGWSTEQKLLDHVREAHKDKLFSCKRCSKTERLRKTLNRHVRLVHGVLGREFYCGHCEMTFEDVSSLSEHIQGSHANLEEAGRDYEELLNDSLFPKEVGLDMEQDREEQEEHQETFLKHFNLVRSANSAGKSKPNPNKMILEEFLDEAFENDQIWTKYIAGGEEYLIDNYEFYLDGPSQATASNYKCPRCEEGFNKQCLLTFHLAEQHNIRCLICNDCGANFNRINEYKSHRQEHLKDNTKFRENVIPEAEEALSLVQREEKEYVLTEHEKGYTFTCKLCERTFAKKCNLEKHQCSFYNGQPKANPNSTPSTSSDSLFCTLCDRKFTSISGLKYHLKRHTDVKAFPCLYCNQKFTANSNLNAHIRNVHSESKNHVCPHCELRFAGKDHLTKHIRSRHEKDRAFACSECSKSYFQKSHLNDHVAAVHSGYKAFSCEQCGASYSGKGSLRRHVAKAHNKGE
uniref:Gastrula zinc finger protein xFG20-1 n=1 Tax=Culex pipiens TaxID=7175 RepID=A0A8D8ADP9_CULPI